MPGVENYHKYPGKKLESVLATCLWEQVGDYLWEKGQSRILVDHIGIFLYRLTDGVWVLTRGLAYNRIFLRKSWRITFLDKSTLNLLDGEWK